uniref:Unkown n=1 Tax=Lycosa singoriensis TaxID=434756 RepID=A9QQA2_LYCSI|nr:unkown [Lycosa singoriensis]
MNVERKHMKYPYTYTAKMAQFPYKFHWDNFWLPRFLVLGMAVSFPFFLFVHRKVNTPANKAFWAEKHKQERQYHFH